MRIKTVGELVEALSAFDPDTPLAMAIQPSYPCAYDIAEPEETEIDGVPHVVLPEAGNHRHVSRDVFRGW